LNYPARQGHFVTRLSFRPNQEAIRVLISEARIWDDASPEETERQQIEERLKRLEAFQKAAGLLASDLQEKLSS
ncbi:hypothetical protein, partial [Salinisphaera hydrothermalis]|uniref:hypothetical protein n=1 Tax=Salinisphaera hydrothermalis TaxID=563188 RepID=UPI00333F0FCB